MVNCREETLDEMMAGARVEITRKRGIPSIRALEIFKGRGTKMARSFWGREAWMAH